tara:strand:- start:195 stop:404 length:210 start_codon:yes stop_codon:yes gene_type:complete
VLGLMEVGLPTHDPFVPARSYPVGGIAFGRVHADCSRQSLISSEILNQRKRMGIEPTKRLFGRFTSFED